MQLQCAVSLHRISSLCLSSTVAPGQASLIYECEPICCHALDPEIGLNLCVQRTAQLQWWACGFAGGGECVRVGSRSLWSDLNATSGLANPFTGVTGGWQGRRRAPPSAQPDCRLLLAQRPVHGCAHSGRCPPLVVTPAGKAQHAPSVGQVAARVWREPASLLE